MEIITMETITEELSERSRLVAADREQLPCKLRSVADTKSEVGGNVGYLVWLLSTRWRAAMDSALAPLGLTQAQYSLLAPLYSMARSGTRPSQRELADATGLDPVYVSKLVRALERAGLLTRGTHPRDPRAVELSLTEPGITIAQQAVKTVYELRDHLTGPLGGNSGTRTAELAAMLRELLDLPPAAPKASS